MHFSFSAVNENADENKITFSAENRKRKSLVPISQNLSPVYSDTTQLNSTQLDVASADA